MKSRILFGFCFLMMLGNISAQDVKSKAPFFKPAEEFNKTRFWGLNAANLSGYSAVLVGLSSAWYDGVEKSKFHLFDDGGEWRNMDKFGHFCTSYLETKYLYESYEWTGLPPKKSMWIAGGLSTVYQGTIEVLDGYSAKWGFSWADIGMNTLGTAAFLVQESLWDEQKIAIKYSTSHQSYNGTATSSDGSRQRLNDRADDLYGSSFIERALKDYNGTTIWASGNIQSFFKQKKVAPKWLNVAVGIGAENLYGGFSNGWNEDDNYYTTDQSRRQQYYLALDVDLSRIKTKSYVLKAVLKGLDALKFPAPGLEFNSSGDVHWHWIAY